MVVFTQSPNISTLGLANPLQFLHLGSGSLARNVSVSTSIPCNVSCEGLLYNRDWNNKQVGREIEHED